MLTRFGSDFWSILGAQNAPKEIGGKIFWGIFWGSKMLFILVLFWIASKMAQDALERPQARPPQETPRGPQERPKRPQEASKSPPGGPKRASRESKSRPRGLKTRPRAPKSHPRHPQGFSEAPGPAAIFENLKSSNHGPKKHRSRLRSPISMNPKGLAKNRRMKKGGRAAVIPFAGGGDPLWGSQSAARPGGAEQGVPDRQQNLYIVKL